MLYIGYFIIVNGQNIKKNFIAFGKSTSQRIYSKQRTHKIGER